VALLPACPAFPHALITSKRTLKAFTRNGDWIIYTEMIRRGVFLAPYHHGYICWRHSDADIQTILGAAEEALSAAADENTSAIN